MRMDHVAMYVDDLEGTRDFFLRYFGAESNAGYHNPTTGLRTYFLRFADGSRLEIMTRPDMDSPEKTAQRTGYAHVAFSTGSREAVDVLTERLRRDHWEVVSGPRVTGDGYYESCVIGPEGNRIEITV